MKRLSFSCPGLSKRRGFTLMEILLVIGLLAVLAGAGISVMYWQVRVQSRVIETAVYMNKFINTELLVRKVLRDCIPGSLTVDVSAIRYVQDSVTPAEDLFTIVANEVRYGADPILENIIGTFTNLGATGTPKLSLPLNQLAPGGLIQVELSTTGRERHNIRFVVRPRGFNPR